MRGGRGGEERDVECAPHCSVTAGDGRRQRGHCRSPLPPSASASLSASLASSAARGRGASGRRRGTRSATAAAGEKEEVSVLPPPRRCRRQTDDSSSPSVSQTSNVGAVVRVATAGERSEEEEGAELAERKRSSAGLGGHGSEEGEQSRVK